MTDYDINTNEPPNRGAMYISRYTENTETALEERSWLLPEELHGQQFAEFTSGSAALELRAEPVPRCREAVGGAVSCDSTE